MDLFFKFLSILTICVTFLIALLIILIALPKSKFKDNLCKIISYFGFGSSIMGGAYVVSPIDLIPDFIPVLGQADDAVIIVFSVIALIVGIIFKKGNSLK